MSSSSVVAALAMVAFGMPAGEVSEQAYRVPVGIKLTVNSAEARLGARVPVVVSLRNFKGEVVSATERLDIALESSLPAKVERISIPQGRDSATATVIFERAGIAKLKATAGKLSPGYAVISVTQQAARRSPPPEFGLRLAAFREPSPDAASGLRIGLKALASKIVPRNRVWTTTVLVAVLNEQREGVRVTEDLPIRLASTLGTIDPEALTIRSLRPRDIDDSRHRYHFGAVASDRRTRGGMDRIRAGPSVEAAHHLDAVGGRDQWPHECQHHGATARRG